MKVSQRSYREESLVRDGNQLTVSMPKWVSMMGLEWLHELLLKSEEVLRTKGPR